MVQIRLDQVNFHVPVRKIRAAFRPRGKRAAIVRRYSDSLLLRAVFSCFHTTGCEAYSFTKDGYGGSLTCAHFWCVPYTCKEVRHKQVCTRVDSEGYKSCSSHCPTRGYDNFYDFQVPVLSYNLGEFKAPVLFGLPTSPPNPSTPRNK